MLGCRFNRLPRVNAGAWINASALKPLKQLIRAELHPKCRLSACDAVKAKDTIISSNNLDAGKFLCNQTLQRRICSDNLANLRENPARPIFVVARHHNLVASKRRWSLLLPHG